MENVLVTSQHVDITSALKSHAQEQLIKVIHKYFENAIDAEVIFSKISHKHDHPFECNIMLNVGGGVGFVKARASGHTAHLAFDGALEKIAHRLSKYKSKIKHHHKEKISELYAYDNNSIKATKYVLSPFNDDFDEKINPGIVSEKETDIELLSVSEAMMKMDLADLPALLFRNKENNRINVVYHRIDGNISWIDPKELND
jgi:ribosomal subunit interface protein